MLKYSIFLNNRLPHLTIQTSKFKNIQNCLKNDFPVNFTEYSMHNITTFPWNIELNDISCSTMSNQLEKTFLPKVDTKLTLDLTSKGKENDVHHNEISFVIHFDTTPIRFELDSTQVSNLSLMD